MTASDKLARAEAMDLMRENASLRKALEQIAAEPNYRCVAAEMRKIARAALQNTGCSDGE